MKKPFCVCREGSHVCYSRSHSEIVAKWTSQDANVHTNRGCPLFAANLNPFTHGFLLFEAEVETGQDQLN